MLELPEKYIESIISMFGEEGKNWLDSINPILDKYINKFNLINIKLIDNLTYNLVLFAECEEYGKVILKIWLPDNEAKREMLVLEKYNENHTCKCYYSNKEDNIMILERLIPGETLHNIKNKEERIKLFCDVALNLIVKVEENLELPTYREVLNRTFKKAEKELERYVKIKELINMADTFYKEIENSNLQKYILHADLHHDNILTSGNNRKAIDPHGFIGEKALETARFIENEIKDEEITKDEILEIIELMSKYFKEEKKLICKCLFIDKVLSTCWDIEGNFEDAYINKDINTLQLILDCYNIINAK